MVFFKKVPYLFYIPKKTTLQLTSAEPGTKRKLQGCFFGIIFKTIISTEYPQQESGLLLSSLLERPSVRQLGQ